MGAAAPEIKYRKGKIMATTFTNQATLTYNGTTVQSNVAVGAVEGVLSMTKQALTDQYSAEDTVTYVISIINNSDAAVSGLTVTDDLGAYVFNTGTVQPLTYAEDSARYFLDGELQAAPAVSTANGLVFTDISVPANGSSMLIYSAQINAFAPLETDGSVTNTAVLTGTGVCDVEASETITTADAAVLAVLKSVTPVPVAENGELTYTFQLQNTGNTAVEAADNAVISDTFNPILRDLSVTLDGAPLTVGTDYTYDEATGVFSTVNGVLTIPAAVYEQSAATGEWTMTPGAATLVVSGTVGTVCDITVP